MDSTKPSLRMGSTGCSTGS